MAADAIPEFLDQIQFLPPDCRSVDLLVVSHGGDPTVAWRIMSLLRERVEKVGVLIPQSAFSAATLLALGADEVVMHPCANLGPVDPQITVARQIPGTQGKEIFEFGSEDLAGFLAFVRDSVGLSDQEYLKSAFEMFCKEVGAVPIGVATRGARLSVSMSEKLLRMHMQTDSEGQKARTIAETLNTKFFHHGYPVGRKEAKEIGLKVVKPSAELETVIWKLWLEIEAEFKSRVPFNPITEVANSANAAALFADVPVINMPSNLPPPMAQQILQQILQQVSVASIPAVDYTLTHAMMESTRRVSAFRTKGKIFAGRGPDMKISLNTVQLSSQWECIPLPQTEAGAQ